MNPKAAIVALSKKVAEKQIKIAEDRVRQLGYEPVHHPDIKQSFLFYAGTAKKRVDELHWAFKRKDIKAIFLIRGGHGICHLLPYLNLNLIKRNAKPLVGYSDITILLNYLNQKTGIITYHGPNLLKRFPSLRKHKPHDKSTECLLDALDKKTLRYRFGASSVLVSGHAEAPIVGGNLALIQRGMGTPYELDTRNKVLFLEATEKLAPWIYDTLWQMKETGMFKQCKGVILGNFNNCPGHESYIQEFFTDFDIPVIWRQKFGHKIPNYTVPVGGMCTLDTKKRIWAVSHEQTPIPFRVLSKMALPHRAHHLPSVHEIPGWEHISRLWE